MEVEFYQKKMEVELYNFIKIWFVVLLSLTYCYIIGNKTSKGFKRFIFTSPVIILFIYLPLHLSTIYLNFFTFFSIAWLANFKLLLFSFGRGPLSSYPSTSFLVFQALASLPIKIKQNRSRPSDQTFKPQSKWLIHLIKMPILARAIYVTTNHTKYHYYHPIIMSSIGNLQFYLIFEMVLTLVSTLAGALLGLELEPSFKEPYISSSLQDHWGRRWNLAASNILRITIHQPVKDWLAASVLGRRWATPLAVVVTFSVSGLIHEVMFYQMVRGISHGEFLYFFVIQGVFVAVEIETKKRWSQEWCFAWRLLYMIWTQMFLICTSKWLICDAFQRYETYDRMLDEYRGLITLFKKVLITI